MFPVEFDYQALNSLPVPAEAARKSIVNTLESIVARPIMTYFRQKRGTDPIHFARMKEGLAIHRLDDEGDRIRHVSLIVRSDDGWSIKIHERIFDFMSFVIPVKPETRMESVAMEERKILAFAEFLLRHQVDHALYPHRKEREVIESDLEFAMHKRAVDPTFYRMLRKALKDEMNGIKGEQYLELLDSGEKEHPSDFIISRMVNTLVISLGELPVTILDDVFPALDPVVKTRVLGECYQRSQNSSFSLVQRASRFQQLLRLFALTIRKNEREGMEIFQAFKKRWGLAVLFNELDAPDMPMEEKGVEELYELFRKSLQLVPEGFIPRVSEPRPKSTGAPEQLSSTPAPTKNLKERIEDVRKDPEFPRQVLEVIDKNKMNAVGQSGAKYTELIESLLAIPWRNIRKIDVSPLDFEKGLNRSHYGLRKPKEAVCDFFSNLIWRYRRFRDEEAASWLRTGSAFLFVGPPGVGKTSFAISIAQNLGIPYHKISLGGMKDESDIRGYGFTYEGSKPGAIVQGLMKMGVMNGMFILDEADKMEKFAIATLLEILDPEQNHLFHDKYTQTTVDIDLSNCHFILTANTIETVPPPVVNRCEVIFLDRYSVDEKISIARDHLIERVREKYGIESDEIYFDPDQETELLRHLVRNHTSESGVREIERLMRMLFLRVQRKEIIAKGEPNVAVTWEKVQEHLGEPDRPRQINSEDRVGEMMALGVNVERGSGSIIPIQVTRVRLGRGLGGIWRGYMSIAHATDNLEKVMDESRKVATTGIFHCAGELGIDLEHMDNPIHIHFMGGSTKKDGPSSGGAIALALASLLLNRKIRRDVSMTGEIDTQGRITAIGALDLKLETAYAAGCKTTIIPRENLYGPGGIERFPDALKQELQILTYEDWKGPHDPFDYQRQVLQVVAVDNIMQAADVAFIDDNELDGLEEVSYSHALRAADALTDGDKRPAGRLRIVHAADAAELRSYLLDPVYRNAGCDIALLTNVEAADAVRGSSPDPTENLDLWITERGRYGVKRSIEQVVASYAEKSPSPLSVSVRARLKVLERNGIRTDAFQDNASIEELKPFASDCTVENVRINGCRSVINRLYHYITDLDADHLNECSFMVCKDGIYVFDLSFIPEKYRLDPQRCQEILNRCLTRWLTTLEQLRHADKESSEGAPAVAALSGSR
jgi:ATP-dependent Lon protease